MRRFAGRVALVTGASRGLGFAAAQALGRDGAHVISVARTAGALEELDDLVRAANGTTTLVPLDITDRIGVARLGNSIHARWEALDYWIHTAVYAPPLSPAAHSMDSDWGGCVETNILAAVHLITCVHPLLRRPDGMAVHVDDRVHSGKFFAAYAASKAAQRAAFESWSFELPESGPRVTSYSPRAMPTGTRARFYPGEDKDRLSPPEREAGELLALL